MKTAIVIGAGHNGLTAAFYLADWSPADRFRGPRRGRRRRDYERTPSGFSLSDADARGAAAAASRRRDGSGATRARGAARACARVFALAGRTLVIDENAQQTRQSITAFSVKDADAFPAFQTSLQRAASVLASAFEYAPPPIDRPGATDLWNLLKTVRTFRSLGRRDAHRLLRWGPMPVADLVQEWFEHAWFERRSRLPR